MHGPFLYIMNGCTDCAKNLDVVRSRLGRWLKYIEENVTTPDAGLYGTLTWHVLREGCPKSSTGNYSAMAEPMKLKLDIRLGTHQKMSICVPEVGCYGTCARA